MDEHRGNGRELAWILWTCVAALFLIFGVAELVSPQHTVSFWLISGLVGTGCSIIALVPGSTLRRMEGAGGGGRLDPFENLEALVTAYQQEATVQASSASALDQKLMGLLAFSTAATGLLLTVSDGLHHWRWILLVGAVGGVVLSLVGLVVCKDTKAGPDPKEFYDEWGGGTPREYIEQLTADLGRTVAKNKDRVELRRGL